MNPSISKVLSGEIVLEGDFTFSSVSKIPKVSTRLVLESPDTVIDLAGISVIDTAGLALLVEWLGMAKRKGISLTFRNLPDPLWAIVCASNLDEWFPVVR
ncbi:MAG: STAS domain-containing protein [Methylococcales bacterium]